MSNEEILKTISKELKEKLGSDASFESLIRELVFRNKYDDIIDMYRKARPESNKTEV